MSRAMPTRERIDEVLSVDVESGIARWKTGHGRRATGDVAGRITSYGYAEMQLDKKTFFIHHLVWFVAHGEWPSIVDHINGIRTDNRLSNLRLADAASNARNRTNWSHRKLLGAYRTASGRFRSSITADGTAYYLGTFASEEEAHNAYVNARSRCAEAERKARTAVLEELQAQRAA